MPDRAAAGTGDDTRYSQEETHDATYPEHHRGDLQVKVGSLWWPVRDLNVTNFVRAVAYCEATEQEIDLRSLAGLAPAVGGNAGSTNQEEYCPHWTLSGARTHLVERSLFARRMLELMDEAWQLFAKHQTFRLQRTLEGSKEDGH